MPGLKLIGFTGEIPRMSPRLLPNMGAQLAMNCRLTRGDLSPIRKSRFTYSFPSAPVNGYSTIYRHGAEWLAWESLVHAVPGPVAQDRLYYMGDGAPKMRVAGTVYPLAVPRPATALTATLGGTPTAPDLSETRLYAYTFVTQFGEESEPCPLSNEVLWAPGNNVKLSGFAAAPAGRAIVSQRIYRSQSSTSGTQLYLIAERAASAANYVDSLPASAIQEPLPALDYNAPPDSLRGLTSLSSGMMAAFSGKDLYFCEPWQPHAWPEKYVLSMDYDIVGLGSYGTTVVVMTTGQPYIVSGTAPENMVPEKLKFNLPCIAARGIQDLGYAIAYPSNDGLVLVSSSGVRVASEDLMTREDWQRLLPATMVCGQHEGRYFAGYTYSEVRGNPVRGTLIMDFSSAPNISRTGISPTAYFYDITTSQLYYAAGAEIYEWDALGEVNEIQAWCSKPFILPNPTNLGALLVEAASVLSDEEIRAIEAEIARITAENQDIFDSGQLEGALGALPINELPINGDRLLQVPTLNQTCSVSIYADGKLVATTGVLNRMTRLPAGFKAQQWEVEITGDMTVIQVTLAETGLQLKEV